MPSLTEKREFAMTVQCSVSSVTVSLRFPQWEESPAGQLHPTLQQQWCIPRWGPSLSGDPNARVPKALLMLILLTTTRNINFGITSVKPIAVWAIQASLGATRIAASATTGDASHTKHSASELPYYTAIRADNEHCYNDSMALERKLFQEKCRLGW